MSEEAGFARAMRRRRRNGFAAIAIVLFACAALVKVLALDFGGDDLQARVQGALLGAAGIGVLVILVGLGLACAIQAIRLSRDQRN